MTERRFKVGDAFVIGNVEYRIRQGKKRVPPGQIDLVLDWRWHSGWEPVPLDHVALIIDAIGENEDVLYPNGKGSAYVMEFLMRARRAGWSAARTYLHLERQAKHERQEHLG